MTTKLNSLWVILILTIPFYPGTQITNEKTSCNILYVGGSGSANFTSIQDACDTAGEEDTVFVYDDSSPYRENIIINTSLT